MSGITLEKLDRVQEVYDEYGTLNKDRTAIFKEDDGTDTLIELAHYNKDNLQ